MKKKLATLLASCALLFAATTVFAAKPEVFPTTPGDTPKGPADFWGLEHSGKSSQLYLYEKVPTGDWPTVADGAWGKMIFKNDAEPFVFNGHALNQEENYTLVKYEGNAWSKVVCMASGISNDDGTIHLSGTLDEYGNKVWLVLSDDVDCVSDVQHMTGWNPTEYLFEYNVI